MTSKRIFKVKNCRIFAKRQKAEKKKKRKEIKAEEIMDGDKLKNVFNRIRAKISTVNLLKKTFVEFEFSNPKLWGYDYEEIEKEETTRINEDSQDESSAENKRFLEFSNADSKKIQGGIVSNELLNLKLKPKVSRPHLSLLAEPPKFFKNSHRITSQSEPEYLLLKSANLKMTYAFLLLEQDMTHYRYLYNERQSSNRQAKMKGYFSADSEYLSTPKLWLEDSTAVVDNLSDNLQETLQRLPELRKVFEEERRSEISKINFKSQRERKIPIKSTKSIENSEETLNAEYLRNNDVSSSSGLALQTKKFNLINKTSFAKRNNLS